MCPLSVTRGITQECTDKTNDQQRDTCCHVTGPHDGHDSDGALDHHYWRCERCGFESTDPALRSGCFRCGVDDTADAADDETGDIYAE